MSRTHAFDSTADGSRSAQLITMFEDAVMDVRHLPAGARYTLGDGDADLPYADVGDVVDVVRHRVGGGIEIVDCVGLRIELVGDAVPAPLLAWSRELSVDGTESARRVALLPSGSRARIALGSVTILVEDATAPERRPLAPPIDFKAHTSTAVSAVVCFLGVLFMSAMPPGSGSLEIDPFLLGGRNARFMFTAPLVPETQSAGASGAPGGGGTPKSESRPTTGRPRFVRATPIRPPGGGSASHLVNPKDAQADAQKAVLTAGVIGVLTGAESTQTGSIFGAGNALGNTADVMANMTGDAVGDTHDAGGLGGIGLVNGGRGGQGGGPGEGPIGSGGIGKIGSCSEPGCTSGRGHGYAGSVGGLGTHRATSPEPIAGTATVTEGMDREIIRRIVRRHAQELKFCYERELQRDASLDGRIVTRFVLQPDGRVTTAVTENSTMHDSKVEGCIADTFKRMQFPRMPAGTGIGIVSYPFTFHKAGG